MHFWMIQRAKNEVFGHFLEFGLLDQLDIAYRDSTKCFPTFGIVTRSWRIIQKSQKCSFEWSKLPKKSFFTIFWSWVCWIDLILHVVIVLNVFKLWTTIKGHEGSFKDNKNAFLNDPKCQKRGFLDLGLMDRLDIAYDDRTIYFPTFGKVTRPLMSTKMQFWMIRSAKKRGFWSFSSVRSVGSTWYCILW